MITYSGRPGRKFYVDGQRIDGKIPQEGLADTV